MIRGSVSPIQRRQIQPQGDITVMLQQLLTVAPQILKAHAEMKQFRDDIAHHVSSVKQGPPGIQGLPGRHAQMPEIDYEKIANDISKKIKFPKDGKDGKQGKDAKSPSVEEILNSLFNSKRLTLDQIIDLRPHLDNLRRAVMRGGGDTVAAGTGITIMNTNGVKTISAPSASGTNVYDENLSSQLPSSTLVLAHTPIAGTVRLYRGGARQNLGAGNDYTISGATITLIIAAVSGETIVADYAY